MNVLLFGGTGMIGGAVLRHCLQDDAVESVLSIGRNPVGISHDKLHEIIEPNLFEYEDIQDRLKDIDVCLFCLGVSAAGMTEERYRHLTYDLTVAAAEALLDASPQATFCYVSGVGTDSSERGRMMWARVKGKTENRLLAMPFRAAYMVRPGFIQPVGGARSRTRLYQALYTGLGWTYPLLKRVFPNQLMTSDDLARAMLRLARVGASQQVLEPPDILRLAADAVEPGSTD